MSICNIPELTYLLSEVERKHNRRIATTTDFESLSVVIEHHTGELLSASIFIATPIMFDVTKKAEAKAAKKASK